MTDVLWLYARGPEEQLRRWPLSPGTWVVGRGQAQPGKLELPWDPTLSRSHFTVSSQGRTLLVTRIPESANPLFWEGRPCERFEVGEGQHFVAGETRFQVLLRPAPENPADAEEFTMAEGVRQRLREQRAAECLQALTRLLPRLRGAAELEELWDSALDILRSLLPAATRVQILKVNPEGDFSLERGPGGLSFQPSRRLLKLAFDSGQTAVHRWHRQDDAEMTMVAGVSWALASPIAVSESERYAVYALGTDEPQTGEQERALIDLVGESLGHFLAARRANRIHAQVGQFFSPLLRQLLDQQGLGCLMEPVRRTVTVLFFDLRGFSKATERAEEEALASVMRYHSLLTEVMTEVTRVVFKHEGVVLDYAGDAVMAGWGAPQAQPEHAQLAVAAACEIVEKVKSMDLPFGSKGLPCGLGMGCGEVVAGQVGGLDQFKYGWIGGVVNQAARLEGLTKVFGVPILITGRLRQQLGQRNDVRRIGRARPAGMEEAVELHEVGSALSAAEIAAYEQAERAFASGDMLGAIKHLRAVPVEDTVGRFLGRLAYRYEASGVPDPWDGVIEFHNK